MSRKCEKKDRQKKSAQANQANHANQTDQDPKVPKRLLRRLTKLEDEMRLYLPNLKRVPAIESENQVKYFIKLFETFLVANTGSLRDEAIRQLILKKLWLEYYLW